MISTYTNIPALKANNDIYSFSKAVNNSIEKISSGKKINSAEDAPSEISFTSRFQNEIRSTRQLITNMQDLISMYQTADYAITGSNGISNILSSIREKVVYASSGTLASQDIQNTQSEIENLIDEISAITTSTEFNTKKLLNGNFGASITTDSTDITAYSYGGIPEAGYYHLTDVKGASYHEIQNTNQPNPITGTLTDYTAELGTLGTVSTSGTASSSGSYEVIFNSSNSFDIYDNSTGTFVTSTTTDTVFTIDGLNITISSGGTYADNYKIHFDTLSGSSTLTVFGEGSRGDSATFSLTNANWSTDAMLDDKFHIKFDFDGGELKYNVFDSDFNQMGNWVTAGATFNSYSDSKLAGSSFDFDINNPGKNDIWTVAFGTFLSLNSSGGTFSISDKDETILVNWSGKDRLSDIANRINSQSSKIVDASFIMENGNTYLKVESKTLGSEGRLKITDETGNFVSTLGLTGIENTGDDASFYLNGEKYISGDGKFYNIIDNTKIEVANKAEDSSVVLNIIDNTSNAPMNIYGGNIKKVYIQDITPEALGLKNSDGTYEIDITDEKGREEAFAKVDNAIATVNKEASRVGSNINTIDYHIDSLMNRNVAKEKALSNHMDTGIAKETTKLSLAQLRLNSASAMSAQANLIPQRVLMLLGYIPESQ